MADILLEPQNRLDLRPEDLESLAQAIREAEPESQVEIVGKEPKGYGVTWWEVLNIWITDPNIVAISAGAAGGAAAKLVENLLDIVFGQLRSFAVPLPVAGELYRWPVAHSLDVS